MRCQSCKFSAVCLPCAMLPYGLAGRLLDCRKCRDIWRIDGVITKSLRFVRVCSVYTVCNKVWAGLGGGQMSVNLCPTCIRKTKEAYITLTKAHNKIIITVRKDNVIEKMCKDPGKSGMVEESFPLDVWLPEKGWHATVSAL